MTFPVLLGEICVCKVLKNQESLLSQNNICSLLGFDFCCLRIETTDSSGWGSRCGKKFKI